MRDMWQRVCIVLVFCVGSLAFIATSPAPPLGVKKSFEPVKIRLTKDRPVRQFAIFVREQLSKDSQPFQAEHGFHFKLFPAMAKDSEGKDIPVATFAIAEGESSAGSAKCFTPANACNWREQALGTLEAKSNPNNFQPFELRDLDFAESMGFSLGGKWIYVKFTLGDVKEASISWQYTIAHIYQTGDEDQRFPREPLVSISTQEVPVD